LRRTVEVRNKDTMRHADGAARRGRPDGLPAWSLYATVFLCGGVLMGMEIVGSRILAPTFGNSIFVWGSLISVVLAALSLGYWLGGKAADRWPSGSVLALFVAVPGVMVGLMPLYYRELNWWIAGGVFGARAGPLVSSVVLFLVPSVFLGTVSPFAVRLQARAVSSVGKTAGGLYAVSTGGSIAGTMATSFWLISVLGVSKIVYVLGAVLIAVAAGIMLVEKRWLRVAVTAAVGAAVLWAAAWNAGAREQRSSLLYEKDSFYHNIRVGEEGPVRYMYFDNTYQTAMLLDDPWKIELTCIRYMALGLALQPDPKRAINIGLGGGSFSKRLARDYEGATVDGVDIDPDVVSVARRFFDVPDDQRLRLHAVDGRRFIRQAPDTYDLVFLDAYNADTIPFHLTTREFYREIASRLSPGGVVVSNIIGVLEGERSEYFRAMYKTLADTFPYVYVFPVIEYPGEEYTDDLNVICVATREGPRLSKDEFVARTSLLRGRLAPAEEVALFASALYERAIDLSDVPVFTDDYAPVDLYRARSL
jgi:spermidine synthase